MLPLALTDVLGDIPDPRSRHGQRHPLPAVLGLVVFALLLGRRGPDAIAQLGRDYGTPLAHALGFRRGKTPAKSMLSILLRRLDPIAVEAALARWIASRLPAELTHVSLDGKTLRGSRDGDVPGQHLVAAYAPEVQAVLAQVRVDAKTNEHKAALQLLGILPLHGRVVVGDAMFCQKDVCQTVRDRGGDYVLMVKDNQKKLAADVVASFGFGAAAFPPGGPRARAAAAGAVGANGGQGARAARAARTPHVADDPEPDGVRAMAGSGTRV